MLLSDWYFMEKWGELDLKVTFETAKWTQVIHGHNQYLIWELTWKVKQEFSESLHKSEQEMTFTKSLPKLTHLQIQQV